MEKRKVTVGIIGLGLIGGSAGLKLKASGFAGKIIGHDIRAIHEKKALALGIIDEIMAIGDICIDADIIILAVPVNSAIGLLGQALKLINQNQVIIDLGSTKHRICLEANKSEMRGQFVACHPIAGTENTGPSAAFAHLFENKVNIICDNELSSPEALAEAEALTLALGMRIKYMDSQAHDRHIAYVSHLSHISAFMLGQTVLEVEHNEKNIFDMAGSGFASTVRLAKSSPQMWAPIFSENADNILIVLEKYINNLNQFKELLISRNEEKLANLMQEINVIRKVLDGAEGQANAGSSAKLASIENTEIKSTL